MKNRPSYVEARAPFPARHVAAVLGREPASARGLDEIRHHGQSVGRPVVASLRDVHAPAASLGRGPAPTLGDGRPATVSPQAQNKIARAAIPSLPRPCPVTPPKAVLLVLLTLSRLGAPRTASLSSAASASVGRRSSPFVAVVARPRPVGPHLARPFALGPRSAPLRRHPLRAGGRRRCAPPPALGRALRPAPSRPPPCAGRGSCPGPCRFPGRLRRPPEGCPSGPPTPLRKFNN